MIRLPIAAGAVALSVAAGYGLVEFSEEEPRAALAGGQSADTAQGGAARLKTSEPLGTAAGAVSKTLRELVQQQTGTVCETSNGVCEVSPSPINAPCHCGDYVGRVVR